MTATEELQQSWKELKERISRSYQKLRVRILKLRNKHNSSKNCDHKEEDFSVEESETLVEED